LHGVALSIDSGVERFALSSDPPGHFLLQVAIPDGERLATENTISGLMGRDAAPRVAFIMDHAAEADDLDV
jgi:DNA gyrase subunit B/topoisomerase-4 subunit B